MEIVALSPKSVRIKGKQVTLTTNLHNEKNKTASDATILIGKETSQEFFLPEAGVILQGPGEYEVKGTKITGFKTQEDTMYTVNLDGLRIFVGYVSSVLAAKDTLHEHDLALLFTDDVLTPAVMGILNANVFIFIGEKNAENAKAFEKDGLAISKYVVTKEKLPVEKEFVFLG